MKAVWASKVRGLTERESRPQSSVRPMDAHCMLLTIIISGDKLNKLTQNQILSQPDLEMV